MSASARPAERPDLEIAPESPWEFEERYPWEEGFASYFRDWVAPELERWEATRRVGEHGFRRRLPLLLAGWLALTLLIAETSGSLPITLTWAIVLLIIGGALAQGPNAKARDSALRSVRIRVLGFFGLSPLRSLRTLDLMLRAHGLPKGETVPALEEQFWGVYQGIGIRLARLAPATTARRPGLALLIEAQGTDPRVLTGHWPADPLARGEPANRELGQGLESLSKALGGAALDYARDGRRTLIVAHPSFDALDWPLPSETSDPRAEAKQIEAAVRHLLGTLHRILEAVSLLAPAPCEKI